jgi:hypothetical protein
MMEGVGIATPRFGAFACPFCKDMDAMYERDASSTTCMTLMCFCGAICPASCMYLYSGGYGVKIGYADTDSLKPLKLSEIPEWVLEKWAGEEDELYDGKFSSFLFYKILEVIPQKLSYYEATSKVPYDKVLELVRSDSESFGLSYIFSPEEDDESVFSLSEEQTNELAAHYPTLVQFPNYYSGDSKFQFLSSSRLMYEKDPDSDVWYDPFDESFRKKFAACASARTHEKQVQPDYPSDYYTDSSSDEESQQYDSSTMDAYNREADTMEERAYLRGLVQGKTLEQAAEIMRNETKDNRKILKSLGLQSVYWVATGETSEENDENATRFLKTPLPDYSTMPKAPEFTSCLLYTSDAADDM